MGRGAAGEPYDEERTGDHRRARRGQATAHPDRLRGSGWCEVMEHPFSGVSERFAGLEVHGAPQRDLHHEEREDDGSDQRERDVERREREQQVLVDHVLDERDDGVGEAEPQRDPD